MKVAPFITRVATAIKWKQAQRRRIEARGGRRKAAEVAGQLPNMHGADAPGGGAGQGSETVCDWRISDAWRRGVTPAWEAAEPNLLAGQGRCLTLVEFNLSALPGLLALAALAALPGSPIYRAYRTCRAEPACLAYRAYSARQVTTLADDYCASSWLRASEAALAISGPPRPPSCWKRLSQSMAFFLSSIAL